MSLCISRSAAAQYMHISIDPASARATTEKPLLWPVYLDTAVLIQHGRLCFESTVLFIGQIAYSMYLEIPYQSPSSMAEDAAHANSGDT